jgi:hypothetical protein
MGWPGTIVNEVFQDFGKEFKSGCWVGSLDHLPKIIEGRIPLV